MVDYGRHKLSLDEAKNIIDTYDNMSDMEFADQIRKWAMFDVPDGSYGEIYKNVRKAVVDEFGKTLAENDQKINYNLDLRVGLRLYDELSPQKGFDLVKANDDDIWRHISVRVMPDITFIRYPNQQTDIDAIKNYLPNLSYSNFRNEKDSIRMKKKRFYSHTRRIWLKTLWWYIHLGWQENEKKTYEVLKNNGTNIISHFIERPGRGYREQLFRCMLYAYSLLPEQRDKIFRAAAKLNLAKCVSIEPALSKGGEKTYSESLFNEVLEKEKNKKDAEEIDTR